nr:MAG TPA: KilAC domain protein [Caudoviricetes sp.]
MTDLVIRSQQGRDVTTSLIVAEVFGKEHSKVCRDIENLSCSESFNAANFGVISYIDSRGREQKAYEMTKDGFSFLVMGYTGEKAGQFKEAFINEFNRREMMLKSDDYILARSQEILHNRLQMAEKQLEAQRAELEAAAPKVAFANAMLASKNSCLVGELAKIISQNGYTIGQNRLFQWLRENGYLGRVGEYYNVPNQRYVEQGLFEVKRSTRSGSSGELYNITTTKVTPKGQEYFLQKFIRA